MKRADKDLEVFRVLLADSHASVQSFKDREFLRMQSSKVLMMRGEIEMDLKLLADADQHLKKARKTIVDLIDHADKTSLPTPNTKKVNQRLTKDQSKLNDLLAKQQSAVHPPASQPTRDDAHPDKSQIDESPKPEVASMVHALGHQIKGAATRATTDSRLSKPYVVSRTTLDRSRS